MSLFPRLFLHLAQNWLKHSSKDPGTEALLGTEA